jgi:hypothetical protein
MATSVTVVYRLGSVIGHATSCAQEATGSCSDTLPSTSQPDPGGDAVGAEPGPEAFYSLATGSSLALTHSCPAAQPGPGGHAVGVRLHLEASSL